MNRYELLYQQSMPITPNPVDHTLKLLENVIADLDDVEEHFQKPFAV